MGKKQKQPEDTFFDSQEVLREYNEYVNEKGDFPTKHKARVLIQSGKYSYNKILDIGTRIETNYSSITIVGDNEFTRDFHGEYKNEYQKFKSFRRGMIQISDAEDLWGNSITVEISFERA